MPHCTGIAAARDSPVRGERRFTPPVRRTADERLTTVAVVNLADFFASTSITGWDAVIAAAIAIAGWIASGLAKKAALGVLHRIQGITEAAASLIARIVRYSLLLLTAGIVLTVLGAPLQPVLAAVIIVAAICVLALRGIAANFGAGLVIQTRHTVRVGDEIEVLGLRGVVHELNGRAVVIHTAEGRTIHIPNASLLESPVTSHTERGLHRSEVQLRAHTTRHHSEIRQIAIDATQATDRVRSVPGVQALISEHSPEGMTMSVRFWHDPHHHGELRSAVVCALVDAFADADIAVVATWRVPSPPLSPAPPF